MKISSLIFFVLIIGLMSCNKIEKRYYETGELLMIREFSIFDTLHCHTKVYYRTGELKSEGNSIGKNKIGHWVDYYPDGTILWEGNFNEYSQRLLPGTNDTISDFRDLWIGKDVTFEILEAEIPDDTLRFRIRVEGMHPSGISVGFYEENTHSIVEIPANDYYEYYIAYNDLPLTINEKQRTCFEIIADFPDKDGSVSGKYYIIYWIYAQKQGDDTIVRTGGIESHSNFQYALGEDSLIIYGKK